MKDILIVIPARMSSSRLPGKPLIKIAGVPMIHHVWNRALQVTSSDNIVVATEDNEIIDYCITNDINCILTDKAASEVDRVKLVSDKIAAKIYICACGDEPLINVEDIKTIIAKSDSSKNQFIIGRKSIDENQFNDPSKAKIVFDEQNRVLYASRAGIPVDYKGQFQKAHKAIWIHSYTKNVLDSYFSQGLCSAESLDGLSIHRFLKIGIPVYCIDLIGDSWAVDEPKDIKIVEDRLRNLH
jgi:CMP-2-keto-3-deoxyoctulosonic acid synthetase